MGKPPYDSIVILPQLSKSVKLYKPSKSQVKIEEFCLLGVVGGKTGAGVVVTGVFVFTGVLVVGMSR